MEEIDKSGMVDKMGRYTTQSLFFELGGDINTAIYTLKEEDHTFQGKQLISIKKRYIEMRDPTEYDFAKMYFMGWKHWLKLQGNKRIMDEIEVWREELEVAIRSDAYRGITKNANLGDFKSLKWVADRGWDTRKAGRPSKEELEREKRIMMKVNDEFADDIARLKVVHGG